jgi:hypothetical protein
MVAYALKSIFYLILPFFIIFVQQFIKPKFQIKTIVIVTIITIIAGICFKVDFFYYTNSHDTYAATHNKLMHWPGVCYFILSYTSTMKK